MKRIYKYTLPMLEECEIDMPYGALIFNAEMQDGYICVWAIVDTEAPLVKRRFRMYKTGQEVKVVNPEIMIYRGTAKVHVGMDLGMHIFEVPE